jgi:hypothetical protein
MGLSPEEKMARFKGERKERNGEFLVPIIPPHPAGRP